MQRSHDPMAPAGPGIDGSASTVDDGAPAGFPPAGHSDSERFLEDLKRFVADSEALLRQARTLSGEGALAAREEFERRLAQARRGLRTARAAALDHVHDWRDGTERYVRNDPWKALGIAAGLGFVLGVLSGRRR